MLRKLWIPVLAISLGALACTTAQPVSQPTGADDQPKYGGTFKMPADDPFDYDMSYAGSTGTNATLIKLGYSTLMRLKTGPDIGYSQTVIEPYLTERWEVSPDVRTFTFHLRKGVKFADVAPVNGRELTSADVKWSLEYATRTGALKDAKLPKGQFDWMFEGLESVQAPDPFTVVVRFKEGFAPFLSYAASSDNVIMPREIYDQEGHFKDKLVGSGPFQPDFSASQQRTSWVLKKNPTYFEQGKPYLDEVRLLVIKDDATRQAAFQTKQIDFITATDFRIAEEVRRSVPTAVEAELPSTPTILMLNFKRPPFDDFRIRRAVSLALDRDELVQVLEGSRGQWALSMSNIFSDLFTQEEIKSFVKYDPEEARRLLKEAGYAQGLQIEIVVGETGTRPVELMQAQLKKVGINLILKPVIDTTPYRRGKDFNALYMSEAQRNELDGSLHLAVHPAGAFNYQSTDDPRINALLAAQRREPDPAKRLELLRELLRYANESANLIPTWRRIQYIFMQPHVRGWYHQGDYRAIGSVWNTWLAK